MVADRLYLEDSWRMEFDGRVAAHAEHAGRPSVLLDRTAFYPESGGQMADHGTLGEARVVDVQVDEDGKVHHVVDGSLPGVGETVRGAVDRARRRTHMALHTGQHMLSRALLNVAKAETVSSRLGENACTIDVHLAQLADRDVAAAEDLVNSVVDDDVEVVAFFPSPEELAQLPLRRAPKVAEDIRVVRVGEFDHTPCGGTHCTRSAQVGLVRVTSLERYKGKMRVTFSAGPRARRQLFEHAELLGALAKRFTCGPQDVARGVEALDRSLADARDSLSQARGRIIGALADELEQSDAARVVAELPDADPEALRALAGRLTKRGDRVVFLAAPTGDAKHAIVARGADATFDCGAFFKALRDRGGKGGGRPERAEGRVPADADWPALVDELAGGE
jgi:alanyl-tRNA synthetase